MMQPKQLEDDRLYMFVFGPGFGESIAIRIPPNDWVVVDSCLVGGSAAAKHPIAQYGGQLSCLVLTHPHRDHYPGFDSLLELGQWDVLGASDTTLDIDYQKTANPKKRLNATLEQVMSTYLQQWTIRPQCTWRTWRGATKKIGVATLTSVHPDEKWAQANAGANPNNLSSAILLEWEGVRLLLGADVENPFWQEITEKFDARLISQHTAAKVPHHGSHATSHSQGAIHKGWSAGDDNRNWVVTPYNKGRGLPSKEDGEGADQLLDSVSVLALTGLPIRHSAQQDSPCETTRQAWRDGTKPKPITIDLPGDRVGTLTQTHDSSLKCYVVFSFTADGTQYPPHYGPGSIQIRNEES